MVFSKDFVWLHIGKTGGTTTEYLFTNFCSDIIEHADGYHQREKHEPLINVKKRFPNEDFDRKIKVVNFRKILSFIVSHNFDRFKSAETQLNKEEDAINQSKKGLLYSQNEWKTVDEFTKDYFEDVSFYIRMEFLIEDFTTVFKKFKKDLVIPNNIHLHKNTSKPKIDFTQTEVDNIYSSNPLWMSIQEKIYAS